MNTPFDPPDMWCPTTPGCFELALQVCGGGWGGATAGFVIQWQKRADWDVHGWPDNGAAPSPSFCSATFTGDLYSLDAYECVTITFGSGSWGPGVTSTCSNAPLAPNTEYIFRSLALASSNMSESPWSGSLRCSTEYNCPPAPGGEDAGCTYTVGYWKNHGPGSRQGNEWPLTQITLGTVVYTDAQAMRILREPTRGNGLVSLARQLIAAKLNVANGASDAAIAGTIAEADALIGGRIVPPIGTGYLHPSQTSSLTDTLTAYNEGDIGPGHCDD